MSGFRFVVHVSSPNAFTIYDLRFTIYDLRLLHPDAIDISVKDEQVAWKCTNNVSPLDRPGITVGRNVCNDPSLRSGQTGVSARYAIIGTGAADNVFYDVCHCTAIARGHTGAESNG
jgi:hypothetical protein